MGKRGPERSEREIQGAIRDVFQLTMYVGEGVVNRAAQMGVIVPESGPGKHSLRRAVETVIFRSQQPKQGR